MNALCINCLTFGEANQVPVGTDRGPQHDPYRRTIVLCPPCCAALCDGQLSTFHDRFSTERNIERASVEGGPA